MGIFRWVRNKISGKEENFIINSNKRLSQYATHDFRREEFEDWPQTLLSIGTFGAARNNEETTTVHQSLENQQQDEKPINDNCKLKNVDLIIKDEDVKDKDDGALIDNAEIIKRKAIELFVDNQGGVLKKRSLKFLLKKMFVCHSGFATPKMNDHVPDSSMAKVLKAMLQKRVYPHGSTQKPVTARYLEKKPSSAIKQRNIQGEDKSEEGRKWVKTDSEYIVLEI